MKDFDRQLRDRISREDHSLPPQVRDRVDRVLEGLPEREKRPLRLLPRITALAASLLFVLVVLMPNLSPAYAESLARVPVLGELVRVFTIRTYVHEEQQHNLDAEIPAVSDPRNPDASSLINKDVDELTGAVIRKFYEELELTRGEGVGSIHIDYELLTNTPDWFTMKLTVEETIGSTNSYSRFYHIDRVHGSYVQLSDLINEADFPVLEEKILGQMRAQMEADPQSVYLIQAKPDSPSPVRLKRDQGFYFTPDGDLVIVYDRYTVAPGSMGCPEFTLPRAEIQPLLRYEAP